MALNISSIENLFQNKSTNEGKKEKKKKNKSVNDPEDSNVSASQIEDTLKVKKKKKDKSVDGGSVLEGNNTNMADASANQEDTTDDSMSKVKKKKKNKSLLSSDISLKNTTLESSEIASNEDTGKSKEKKKKKTDAVSPDDFFPDLSVITDKEASELNTETKNVEVNESTKLKKKKKKKLDASEDNDTVDISTFNKIEVEVNESTIKKKKNKKNKDGESANAAINDIDVEITDKEASKLNTESKIVEVNESTKLEKKKKKKLDASENNETVDVSTEVNESTIKKKKNKKNKDGESANAAVNDIDVEKSIDAIKEIQVEATSNEASNSSVKSRKRKKSNSLSLPIEQGLKEEETLIEQPEKKKPVLNKVTLTETEEPIISKIEENQELKIGKKRKRNISQDAKLDEVENDKITVLPVIDPVSEKVEGERKKDKKKKKNQIKEENMSDKENVENNKSNLSENKMLKDSEPIKDESLDISGLNDDEEDVGESGDVTAELSLTNVNADSHVIEGAEKSMIIETEMADKSYNADKSYLSVTGGPEDDVAPKISLNKLKENRGVVYVSHVPHGFYEKQMREFFGQFGTVTDLRLGRSKKTGRSCGYAFIEFKYKEVAGVVAETMNNYLMFDKILKAEVVPTEKCSIAMFKGKIKPNRPPGKMQRMKDKKMHNSTKTPETIQKRQVRQMKKVKKMSTKLKALGIDYNFKIAEMSAA